MSSAGGRATAPEGEASGPGGARMTPRPSVRRTGRRLRCGAAAASLPLTSRVAARNRRSRAGLCSGAVRSPESAGARDNGALRGDCLWPARHGGSGESERGRSADALGSRPAAHSLGEGAPEPHASMHRPLVACDDDAPSDTGVRRPESESPCEVAGSSKASDADAHDWHGCAARPSAAELGPVVATRANSDVSGSRYGVLASLGDVDEHNISANIIPSARAAFPVLEVAVPMGGSVCEECVAPEAHAVGHAVWARRGGAVGDRPSLWLERGRDGEGDAAPLRGNGPARSDQAGAHHVHDVRSA